MFFVFFGFPLSFILFRVEVFFFFFFLFFRPAWRDERSRGATSKPRDDEQEYNNYVTYRYMYSTPLPPIVARHVRVPR